MRCNDEIYGTQFLTNSSLVVWMCHCWFFILAPPPPCQCLFHEYHLWTVFFLLVLPGLPPPPTLHLKISIDVIPRMLKKVSLENFNLRDILVHTYIWHSVIDNYSKNVQYSLVAKMLKESWGFSEMGIICKYNELNKNRLIHCCAYSSLAHYRLAMIAAQTESASYLFNTSEFSCWNHDVINNQGL